MAKKKKATKRQYCYISGKITGLEMSEVLDKFEAAEEAVIYLGYIPINPLKNGVDGQDWGDHMLADIKNLHKCQAVYFLPDWADSNGATVEHIFAKNCGKKMIYADRSIF